MVSTTRLPSSRRRGHAAACAGAGAFTLVELLVVIGIIVLLVGVAITVGRSVTHSGRMRSTEHLLRTLDSGLSADIAVNEGLPTAFCVAETVRPDNGQPYSPKQYAAFPIVDGRAESRQLPYQSPLWPPPAGDPRFDEVADPSQPSLSLLLLQSGEDSQLSRAVQNIDPRFVTVRQIPAFGWRAAQSQTGKWEVVSPNLEQYWIKAPVVQDAFGFPIRVVFPGLGGGSGPYYDVDASQLRTRSPHAIPVPFMAPTPGARPQPALFVRSYRGFDPETVRSRRPVGDADEGAPLASRPYFYSVGPDGDPGTRKDNVYVTAPAFERETQNFPAPMN